MDLLLLSVQPSKLDSVHGLGCLTYCCIVVRWFGSSEYTHLVLLSNIPLQKHRVLGCKFETGMRENQITNLACEELILALNKELVSQTLKTKRNIRV